MIRELQVVKRISKSSFYETLIAKLPCSQDRSM